MSKQWKVSMHSTEVDRYTSAAVLLIPPLIPMEFQEFQEFDQEFQEFQKFFSKFQEFPESIGIDVGNPKSHDSHIYLLFITVLNTTPRGQALTTLNFKIKIKIKIKIK